jgi:uncharacterized membrane protein YeaQ/YmgE (transglycosylase-associated protein family)
MNNLSIFWVWVIVGIIAGYLAKSAMREGPHGILGDLIVGVIGAFVGGGSSITSATLASPVSTSARSWWPSSGLWCFSGASGN